MSKVVRVRVWSLAVWLLALFLLSSATTAEFCYWLCADGGKQGVRTAGSANQCHNAKHTPSPAHDPEQDSCTEAWHESRSLVSSKFEFASSKAFAGAPISVVTSLEASGNATVFLILDGRLETHPACESPVLRI